MGFGTHRQEQHGKLVTEREDRGVLAMASIRRAQDGLAHAPDQRYTRVRAARPDASSLVRRGTVKLDPSSSHSVLWVLFKRPLVRRAQIERCRQRYAIGPHTPA